MTHAANETKSSGPGFQFNNQTYNVLKWTALILLPAIGAMYFALAGIWGFPYGEQVVGTIAIIETFLGAVLGVSTVGYNSNTPLYDGDMAVGDGVSHITLASQDAGPLVDKGYVVLRVVDTTESQE